MKRYRSSLGFNGKKYEHTSTVSQREADKKALNLKRSLENDEVASQKNVPRQVEKIVIPHIGSLRLVNVTDIHLQKILNTRAGGSFLVVKKLRDILKAIFRKARESWLIVYDPAEFLQLPKYTKGTWRSIMDLERVHLLEVTVRGSVHSVVYAAKKQAEIGLTKRREPLII